MRLWSRDVGRFWALALPTLGILFVVGEICHTHIVPARWYPADACILPPLIWCWVLSVRAGLRIDFWTRAVFGIGQAIVLITVYSNEWHRDIIFGDPNRVFVLWVGMTGIYAGLFAAITRDWVAAKTPACVPRPPVCKRCGYLLRGLPEPRCPECGEPFDPKHLQPDEDANTAQGSSREV